MRTDGVPRAGCGRARLRASVAVDGELRDVREAALLLRHLARCPDCARRFAEMCVLAAALRRAPLERPRRRLRLEPGWR